MIIVEVMGGLGNQMQQYALYRKLESLGKDARLDVSWFLDKERQTKVLANRKLELSWFENLPVKYCTQEEKQAILGKNTLVGKLKKKLLGGSNRHFTESDMYHPEIFDLEDAYLSGFWACEAYYADILPMLRSQIHFPDPEKGEGWDLEAAAKNKETMERMKQETSVSIHIRRGDYLDAQNAEMFGGICTDAYYEAAISYIKEQTPDAHFYVFSDDSGYAKFSVLFLHSIHIPECCNFCFQYISEPFPLFNQLTESAFAHSFYNSLGKHFHNAVSLFSSFLSGLRQRNIAASSIFRVNTAHAQPFFLHATEQSGKCRR